MPRKNGKIKKRLPQVKKDISDFLLNEEGKITKKSIAKLGMSLAILAMALEPQGALAQHSNTHSSHSSHSNSFFSSGTGGHQSSTPHSSAHTNAHANHSNHGNHSAHSSGGWC